MVGEKEAGRIGRTEGRKEGSSQAGRVVDRCRAISLCVFDARQSLVPGKFTVWLAANKCRLCRPSLAGSLFVRPQFPRITVIFALTANDRITMHDTTPPLPRDETRHFPSGNLFFLSLHPLCAASNALPALIRPALCFHFNGVQCVYGFRCAG